MTQKLKRLFTTDVNVTKNGGTTKQIRISSEKLNQYAKVKAVIYGIEE